MIAVAPYAPGDQAMLAVQFWQARHGPCDDLADQMSRHGLSWTVCDGTGRVICCAGLVEVHAGFAIGWAALALGKGHDMVALTRRCRAEIANAGYRRVELHCDVDFKPAHRWAMLLGFQHEGIRRAWTADGRDQMIFVRIAGEHHGL